MTSQTTLMAIRFVRNFAIFFALLITCAGGLGYIIVQGTKDADVSSEWILHTHNIIVTAEELSTLFESILSTQRGYLLLRDPELMEAYQRSKITAQQNIEKLQGLVRDNPAQAIRVEQLRVKFGEYTNLLEKRIAMLVQTTAPGEVIQNLRSSPVRDLREEIFRINTHILRQEHELMTKRFSNMQSSKRDYFTSLVLGGSVSLMLLLVLNSFLLHAQAKRTEAEHNLEITQERLALAVQGARDGIFDWDLITNDLFWSREYKAMLGYDENELIATIDNFRELVHPDDRDDLWQVYDLYINGSTSEFDHVFRMQHKSGRWIWIHARGKCVFDENNKPTRFLGAHSDITNFKDVEKRLADAKSKAEKANRAKTEFLAHMSHEIRTPLTAITGIAEILQRQLATLTERQQQLVRTLHSSTSSLRDLINDILDFSKIESGEIELKDEEAGLSEIFDQVISMMAVPAGQKNLQFNFVYDALKNERIICDPMRVRQILINLINNAIKFTEKGSINVHASRQETSAGAMLRVDVHDTGIGIAPEDYVLIFERFKQVDSTASRKHGGTGLGLPISQNLARLMDGEIQLASTVGVGSTFTLLLPFRQASSTVKAAEQQPQKSPDYFKGKVDEAKKILMVEDYEGNIVVLSYILDELGCNYDLAKTGVEALRLWERNHYDLVLMDIQMPEMDGFQATSRIRELEQERERLYTPIIGMTAHALVGDKDKCIAAGMDAYLPKPINETDLKNKILHYLNADEKAA